MSDNCPARAVALRAGDCIEQCQQYTLTFVCRQTSYEGNSNRLPSLLLFLNIIIIYYFKNIINIIVMDNKVRIKNILKLINPYDFLSILLKLR